MELFFIFDFQCFEELVILRGPVYLTGDSAATAFVEFVEPDGRL